MSTVNMFPHDISFFLITHNTKTSANESNTLLRTKSEWPNQWKLSFCPDLNKQNPELIS